MDEQGSEITFGQWLRWRRRALDLTQAELAARVPCAKGTIRRLEADDLRPSKPLAERLAEVLGVSTALRAEFIHFARSGFQSDRSLDHFTSALRAEGAALAADPTPTRPARRYPLPAAANPLLGRAHTTDVAIELLLRPEVRLVTLIGPPGVGKTRLALQIAGQLQPHFREGACFVALAPLSSAERVLPAIAQAIDLLDSGRPLATALAERLRGEQVLLVLDNAEHVISAAPYIADLLAAAPLIKILCTSRIPLRIAGEHEFVVPPLALPVLTSPLALEANPAVALFVARARAVQPSLTLTPHTLQQIAEITHRLDGLPLALELAATRSKLFLPSEILTRIERRLPFLTGGTRDAPARQRTLEAAIAWSYDLLTDEEKICLARLGVFWGGWSLAAAEAIGGDRLDMLNGIATLVDHSLVQSLHSEQGEARFSMLETIREFALARLNERAEVASLSARHADYYLALAIEAEQGLQGSDQVAWMRRLNVERHNVRAAFALALSTPDMLERGLQAGASLWWFWWTNGQVGEGRQWLHDLLQHGAQQGLASSPAYGRALLGAGILAFFASEFDSAMPQFVAARDLSAACRDAITHGYAIFMIGTVLVLSSKPDEGYVLIEEGSRILRAAGTPAAWHVGVTSLARTLLSFERGALDEAQQHADTGMALFRQLGQPYGIGLAYNYQGDVARLRDDLVVAADRYAAALPLLRQANAKSEIPAVLHNLAHTLLAQNQTEHAGELFADGLELQREIGNRMGMAECLIGLAAVAVAQGQLQQAAAHLTTTDALLAELNVPLFAAEQAIYQRIAEKVRSS